ncbi:MAG TPA: response regulator [Coleofasciculaceae cyanobacterium]|jgi:CheY-like chemotaxis protein
MTEAEQVILLVEDNPNDEELTRIAFERNNITNPLVVAHDGVEALDYVFGTGLYEGRDIQEQPQVIVLDLKLPKVNGLEVLERIRSDPRTAFIPVVVLTSSKEEEDKFRAYQLGTNAYVRKPVDFIQFTEAVKQLGLFWLLLNEVTTCCEHCGGSLR